MSLHHDPVSGFTSHEPDHHALTKVKREPDITAHVWSTSDSSDWVEGRAEVARALRHCAACGRIGAKVVNVERGEVKFSGGATVTLWAVVIKHPRS